MNASIIKKNIDYFLGKWLFIVCIVFTIYLIPIRSSSLSYWEFELLALTDMFYVLYMLVLSYIFFVLRNLGKDEQEILIRSKTYLRYFIAQSISLVVISTVFVFLHVLIAVIMGLGLDFHNVFTNSTNGELLFWAKHFDTPLAGLAGSVAYMIVGLSILGMCITFLNHYLKTRTVVMIVILAFILTMINYQAIYIDSTFSCIFLNNYILLSHALYALGANFYLLPVCEVAIAAILLFLIKKFWYKQIGVKRNNGGKMDVVRYYLKLLFRKKNVLIVLIASGLITLSVWVLYEDLSFNDLLLWQFWGQGEGGFFPMWFLTMLVYNGVPIYLLCYFLDKDSERSIHLTIRLRRIGRWMNGVFLSGAVFLVCYVLASVGISALAALVAGMDFAGFNGVKDMFSAIGIQSVSPWFLYIAVLAGKSMELIFYFLVIFLLYCFTKKISIGFILLQLGYFVYLIPAAIFRYLPAGIGSLSRIREFSGTGVYFWQAAAFLLAADSILYGYIRWIGCKKIFY